MHFWFIITRKIWLLGRREGITLTLGFGIPIILSLFSILPQIISKKNDSFPSNTKNCSTGYRQNAWQIILSGPGTVIPPLIISLLFGGQYIY